MSIRNGSFYPVWPILDGKALNLQWGQVRSNTAETKAIVRNSVQELGSGDELNALRSLLGQEYGDLTFRNKFRFFYDASTKEICCQKNDGTVDTPVWVDSWCIRHSDGQFRVVSTGGIYSGAGFYSDDDSLKSMKEIGETGSSADTTVLNPVRLFFNADDGFGVAPISSGANKGAPEITFTQPFGRAEAFSKAGKEWQVNHAFGVTPVMAQVMDADDRIVIPDKADVSDPNTAYFYFNEPFTGSVYIASGGLGAASLVPRDPFYMVVRTDVQSRAGQTFSPDIDMIFDFNLFYVNVDLDEDAGGAHKSARISLTDAATNGNPLTVRETDSSPSNEDVTTIVVPNGSLTDDGSGQVTLNFTSAEVGARFNTVTAEGFYVQSGGELSPDGLKTRQATIEDTVRAEAFYFNSGGETPQSYVEEFSAAIEWTVNHNLNRQSFIAQAYKGTGLFFIPDVIDVSDSNTAYFYFESAQDGKAVILGVG